MTGIVSAMADNLALGLYVPVLAGFVGLLSFLMGSACTAIMVNYARRRNMHSEYAFPLLLEAMLLLCFGILGATWAETSGLVVSVTVMLLCFMMGLQNAVITKISNAEIRTTHVTGIVTDIGIELGKLVYWNSGRHGEQPMVMANRDHLKVLSLLLMFFFVGGIVGALSFKHIGYRMTIPLALILVTLTVLPAFDDFAVFVRGLRRK